ncbi:MAG: Asp23/Gls24 family envelope stress response protein [Bacillota bacterium]|nr:MAG: Asp23/Gls24 family envelope stress response protein [Bacillota bacterium]
MRVAQSRNTELGSVSIAEEVIATIAGVAATECYGLVGMGARGVQKGLAIFRRGEDVSRGVEVTLGDDTVTIDLHVVVQYGVNIAEVAHNVMEQVKYAVEHYCGLQVQQVNVHVESVRVDADGLPESAHARRRQSGR